MYDKYIIVIKKNEQTCPTENVFVRFFIKLI